MNTSNVGSENSSAASPTVKLPNMVEVYVYNSVQLEAVVFRGSHERCRMWLRRKGFTPLPGSTYRFTHPDGTRCVLVG